MSKVEIVMTSYNGEKYIADQIDSILASSYEDFLLSIYDDGSRDATMDILYEYEGRYPDKIKVYQNQNNLGVTMNFIQGVLNTRSNYIMLCDQDDVWKTSKIESTLKRMKQMEAKEGADTALAVFTDAVVVNQDLEQIHPSFFKASHLNPRKTGLSRLLMENKLIGCTVMINSHLRNILSSSSLPKHAKFHDGWIGLIASSMGKISFLNEATLLYRQHGANVVGNISFISYIKDRALSLGRQRKSVLELQLQAKEFYKLYKKHLTKEDIVIIKRFANINKENFIKRKYYIIRYGYLKTGFIRNVGLMIII